MDGRAAAAALRDVSRSLRALSSVPSRIARRAAEELQDTIDVQTASETDPYGRPWAALAPATIERKRGDERILRRTDKMLDELKVAPMSGAGLSISTDAPYSAFHQVGTKNMPARKILPDSALPASWNAALTRASRDEFEDWKAGA